MFYVIKRLKEKFYENVPWFKMLGSEDKNRTENECSEDENVQVDEWKDKKYILGNEWIKDCLGLAQIVDKMKKNKLR